MALWDGLNVELKCQSVRSLYGVWPLTASMEVKNNHAHVTTHRILNKFIGMKFSIGCMVWPWCCQFQDLTAMIMRSRSASFDDNAQKRFSYCIIGWVIFGWQCYQMSWQLQYGQQTIAQYVQEFCLVTLLLIKSCLYLSTMQRQATVGICTLPPSASFTITDWPLCLSQTSKPNLEGWEPGTPLL